MKNLILMVFIAIAIISCTTYSHAVVSDDGFVYEYSYNKHPVIYVNGMPYHYHFHDNVWGWSLVDRRYYGRIIHHQRPLRYNREYYRQRPRLSSPDRIPRRPHIDRGGMFGNPNRR